ncbi:MAG: S8 family peptidase [Bacteroidetes bacterium]|nr:S8 family peptidase [Bacteroidota bacterium]MBU1719697.1 S8 family peptidase [Bacteroidota bacterium]
MKRFTGILTLLIAAFAISFGQRLQPRFVEGVVYFRINPSSGVNIPLLDAQQNAAEVLKDFPAFAFIAGKYGIYSIEKPFRTPKPEILNTYKIRFHETSEADALIKEIESQNFIVYAEKAPLFRTFSTNTNADDVAPQQWYLGKIGALQAWGLTTGNPNIKVAIVDDASRITHPDLAANVWHNPGEIAGNSIDDDSNGYVDDVNGWDAANNDNDPNPPVNLGFLGEMAFTHGTHCAGLAAAVTNNGTGIAGVSYNISYIPVKTVTDNSFFPLGIETPAEGADYAIAAGANVISMSFGSEDAGAFATLTSILQYADSAGIILVAAAGNNGDGSGGFGTPNAINYPAGYPYVLAIGASDSTDHKPGFSQYGTWLDLLAPGAAMYSTLAHSTPYDFQDGTSMACPLTVGALGLMLSYAPMASKTEIVQCLKDGCDNIDSLNPTFVGQMGAGRLNVYNSLICLQQYLSDENAYTESANAVVVFPNPAKDLVSIFSRNELPSAIEIRDLQGRLISRTEIQSASGRIDISTNNLVAGVYLLHLVSDGNADVRKIIIRR